MVAALYGPTIRIFCGVVDGNATTSLFGDMIGLVLHVHVLLHEIAALILKVLTIQSQQFCEEAGLHLFVQLVDGVTVNEVALPRGLGVKVQKGEISAL